MLHSHRSYIDIYSSMKTLDRLRPFQALVIAMSDALLINAAVAGAYWARYVGNWVVTVDESNYVPYSEYVPASLFLTVSLLVIFKFEGLYTSRRGVSWLDRAVTIFHGTLVGIAMLIVAFFLYRPFFYSRLMFAFAGAFIVIVLAAFRFVLGVALGRLRSRGVGVESLLIVGASERGRALMRTIVARPELGYRVIGFLDDDPARNTTNLGRFPALGAISGLARILSEKRPDEVIVTLSADRHLQILRILNECEKHQTRVKVVPDLYEMTLNRVAVDDINGIPLIGVREVTIRGWNFAVKRAIDIGLCLVTAVVLSPLFVLVAIAIKLDSPGPIFFKQIRIGRVGRPFICFKFRSMREGAEKEREQLAELNEASGPLFKIKNDPRLTRMGRFFRRTSLDEFPQIINVLRGEMSLVGPRPPLPSEAAQYEEWHKKRLEVAPGMSGLWQVSGRSLLTFDEMVMLDLFYIENWSLSLDLKIMLRTVPSVLLANGAY
jgi:exopolysaccharide biosynthesis polyprenyl glycosylphosphotransferase